MHSLITTRKKHTADIAALLGNKPVESSPLPQAAFAEKITFEGRDLRVVWLRQSGADYTKVSRLLGRCVSVGLRVQLFEEIDTMARIEHHRDMVLQADMVLLEAFGRIGRETYEVLLEYVRKYSIAPVVMLTEDASAERTVAALHAGADAVVLLNMPEEVIVARLHSLLRRWFYAGHLPPQTLR